MGFLKRLLGGEPQDDKQQGYVDKDGLYLYVRCDNCGSCVRMRIDKQYDLERDENQFVWHKTIVDNRCFRRIPTVVTFDAKYAMVNAEITGGQYITEDVYNAWYADYQRQKAEGQAAAAAASQTAVAGTESPADGE